MMTLEERLQGNGSFAPESCLRLVWSASSLGAFKKCPRYYELSNLQGWTTREGKVDLDWGSLVHQSVELYRLWRPARNHQETLRDVVQWALKATWDAERRRPQSWPDPQKNRVSLIRALVWYLDEWKDDPLQTIQLADGAPAVELSFAFQTGYVTQSGEPYLLQGRLDRLVSLQGQTFISDLKTTRMGLTERYFSQFSPDDEFSLYSLAGRVAFNQVTSGIIVDALQVGVNFVRCQRQLIGRSQEVVEEWYEELPYWLKQAEACATHGVWPQNQQSCGLYGGCEFRSVCSRAPGARAAFLEANFVQRPMRAGFGQSSADAI